jgi:hypothetical protein
LKSEAEKYLNPNRSELMVGGNLFQRPELPLVLMCLRSLNSHQHFSPYTNPKTMENTEKRVTSDCRKLPSNNNCSLSITGTEAEVLPVAIWHAVNAHGHEDTPELREMIKGILEKANPNC